MDAYLRALQGRLTHVTRNMGQVVLVLNAASEDDRTLAATLTELARQLDDLTEQVRYEAQRLAASRPELPPSAG